MQKAQAKMAGDQTKPAARTPAKLKALQESLLL